MEQEPTRTPVDTRMNRVHWFAGRVHEVLDEVAPAVACVAELDATATAESVVELSRAMARMDALRVALLAHADRVDVATEAPGVAATSTGAWLAQATNTPHGQAFGLTKLAHRLATGFEATNAALLAGAVDTGRAQVITDAVAALPVSLGMVDRDRAEPHLLAEANRHDAKKLKLLARHLLHVIDPDAADAELARRMEAEEAAAARKTMLTLFDDGAGTCHGRFGIPTLHGAMLAKALDALASPTRPDAIPREVSDADGRVVKRATPEMLGEALCQLLERFPTTKLPRHGGVNATVVVTMELEKLLHGVGAGTLDTGHRLSAGHVRRLACQAGVIPAVLGTASEVLDLGRTARFHTRAHRIVLGIRDKTCTAVGCDRPAGWCHAHHDLPWSAGGGTSVSNGRLLCPRHHTLAHHPGYTTMPQGNGRLSIAKSNRRRQ